MGVMSVVNNLVIGLGSMGKRRIRLIKEMFPDYKITGVDRRDDRRDEVAAKMSIETIAEIKDIDDHIDCAFVCTPPVTHSNIINECLNRGWNVFTELNLIDDGYIDNMRLADDKGCTLFLSSTFLYREEIRYLRSRIGKGKKWNYIYHIGQYLPNWHPWENYRDFFVGDVRTNGCREILAIELPWITEAFGKVNSVDAVSDRMTGLEIDYDDNYIVRLIHENGCKGIIMVDVVSMHAVRRLEVYSEGDYYAWNGTPDSLYRYDMEKKGLVAVRLNENAEHEDGYSEFIVENAYKNEIREFYDVVLNKSEPVYGFKKDMDILRLIDKIGA